tara:strand:+ start:17434 stop:18369 length:936 start_codon:yes stop_codon:yes gene_type:complete
MLDNNKNSLSSSKQLIFWISLFSWIIICLFTMGLLNLLLQPETDQVLGHVEEGTEWFEEYREISSKVNGRTNYRDEYRCFAYLNYTYSVNEETYFGSNGQPVEYTLYKSSKSCIDNAYEYHSSSFNISVWYYPDDPANSRLTEDVEEITDALTCCCCFQFFIGLFFIYLGMYRINNNDANKTLLNHNSSTTQSITVPASNQGESNKNLVLVFFKKITGLFLILFSILPLYIVYEANTKPTVNAGGDLSIPFTCCGIIGIMIGVILILPSMNYHTESEQIPVVLINETESMASEENIRLPSNDWWNTSSENK